MSSPGVLGGLAELGGLGAFGIAHEGSHPLLGEKLASAGVGLPVHPVGARYGVPPEGLGDG